MHNRFRSDAMDLITDNVRHFQHWYAAAWEKRDRRVDGWFLMDTPVWTMLICATYVYLVKVAGPNYMKDRKPMNIRGFLVIYNFFQVALSTYIFVELLRNGWGGEYSFRCQPVDYSNDPKALKVPKLP